MSSGADGEAQQQFIDEFAGILTAAGLPRMPARVWAAVLTSDDGCTSRELTELLRISPAAVSGAVRYLEQLALLARRRAPGSRSDRYVVRDDAWFEAIATESERLRALARSLERGLASVPAGSPAAERMAETRDFFAFYLRELPPLLERWRASRGG
jgi:DNA-binding transcriptional regulator GbsR (MarR family)